MGMLTCHSRRRHRRTGVRRGGETSDKQGLPPTPPPRSRENLPKWAKLIESGKSLADIIAMASTKERSPADSGPRIEPPNP